MTTKKDDVSRRSVLGGALAALAASPAPALAATRTGDDAVLIALCEECRREVERLQEAYRRMDAAAAADLDGASGPAVYEQQACGISEMVHELENRIAKIRATTLDGMHAKVRALGVEPAAVQNIDDFERVLEERLDAGHLVGLSLILDVLHMNESEA